MLTDQNRTQTKKGAVEGAAIYYVEKKNVTNEDIAYNWGNTGKDNDSKHKKDNYWGIY